MSRIRRRTRVFIARRFQIRYITLILVLMFTISFLTGYTVYVTTWIMFGEKLAAVYPQGLLLDIVKKVNMVLLLRLIFITPLLILVGLILSHRIAGPIYRIRKYIKGVIAGNYDNRLKLRKKDEMQDLADLINRMVAMLAAEQGGRKYRIDEMKRKANELEAAVIAGSGDKEKLVAKVLEIRDDLDNFVA